MLIAVTGKLIICIPLFCPALILQAEEKKLGTSGIQIESRNMKLMGPLSHIYPT